MPVAEAVVKCGATLVKKLADTGTGSSKLDPCRRKLADVHRSEQGRIATAEEILAVLEEHDAPAGTIAKARTIIGTGEWKGPPNELEVPIEVQLLGGGAIEEYHATDARKKAEAMAKLKKDEAPKPDQPGIHASPAFGEANPVGPVKLKK